MEDAIQKVLYSRDVAVVTGDSSGEAMLRMVKRITKKMERAKADIHFDNVKVLRALGNGMAV